MGTTEGQMFSNAHETQTSLSIVGISSCLLHKKSIGIV